MSPFGAKYAQGKIQCNNSGNLAPFTCSKGEVAMGKWVGWQCGKSKENDSHKYLDKL